jgi:hypothetical protein
METDRTMGRTPALGQVLDAWRRAGDPPTWDALCVELGPFMEAVCLLRWSDGADDPVIESAGAQAVLACGAALSGRPASTLGADAPREAAQARDAERPFTVQETIHDQGGVRRLARLYLPLAGPSMVACAVVRTA